MKSGRREIPQQASSSSSGSFAKLTFADILHNLLREAATGRLRVASGPWRKTIYFEKGRPVYAVSTDPADGVDEVLRAAGRLTPEQLRAGLEKSPTVRRLGAALVELGYVAPADLVWATREQVRRIVLSAFTLSDGTFLFERGELAGEDIVRLPLQVEAILREGVTRMTDPHLLLRALGSLEGQLEAPPEARPAVAIALEPREASLLESLRARRMSVRELCRSSRVPAIDTCRSLVALVTTGAARRVEA